ncbi:MFS transporter [Streptobacillus felis]|uniref:MFS transporter n=1 Tax=Streptobacillus felis TaxID=1384509 RepID=A0A7Z0PEK5_9FUSO|nr:MFS transporter [Streptobacillus felis]NYV27819.1 MFS transporter [Streptobacillus felis]
MSKRLTKATYFFYGLGVAYFMLDQIFNQWIQYFYLPSEKAIADYGISVIMPPIYLAIAFVIMRFVDAIADPIVGYMSDNSNSKIGRRSIYMLIGIIPLALSMIAFFYPLTSSVLITTLYLAFVGSVYFVAYTLVGGPYNALIPDLATNKEERLNLSTSQSVFRLVFTAIPLILSPVILSNMIKSGMNFITAIRIMVTGFSFLSAVIVIVSVILLKENKIAVKKNSDAKKINFKDAFSYLKNKEIMLYFIGFFFFFSGFNIIRNSVLYYVTVILGQSEKAASIPTTILFVVSALFFPITQALCKKFDYRKIMLFDLALIIFGTFGLIFLGAKSKLLFFTMFSIVGAGVSGSAFIFPPAMLSEISTKLYEKYNVSVEGMMFGIQGLFLKLALLLQIVTTTLVLPLGGNGGATKLGVLATLVIAIIFLIISFLSYFLKKSEI